MHKSLLETLNKILLDLKNVINYDSSSIMLIFGNHLEIAAQNGFRSDEQYFSYTKLESLKHLKYVENTKKHLIINDTSNDSRWLTLKNCEYINSWLGMPLISNGIIIGILNVDSNKKNYFSTEDANKIEQFAKRATVELIKSYAFESTSSSHFTSALVHTSYKLSKIKEIDNLIIDSWEYIKKYFSANKFVICLAKEHHFEIYEKTEKNLLVKQIFEDSDEFKTIRRLMEKDTIILWNELIQKEGLIKKLEINFEIPYSSNNSFICVPIHGINETKGLIYLLNKSKYSFDKPRSDAFITLVNLLAVAIEKNEILLRQARRSAMLQKLSELIIYMINPDSLRMQERVHVILENLSLIVDAEATSLLRVENRNKLIKIGSFGHLQGSEKSKFNISDKDKSGLTGFIASKRKMFNAYGENLKDHRAVAGKKITHLVSGECRSLLALPLLRNKKVIGLLEAENKKNSKSGFNKDDEWILNLFGEAVINSLLIVDLFEEEKKKSNAYKKRSQIINKLLLKIDLYRNESVLLKDIASSAIELTGVSGKKAQCCYICKLVENKIKLNIINPEYYEKIAYEKIGKIDLTSSKKMGVTDWAIKTNLPIYFENIPGNVDDIFIIENAKSAISVPIVIDSDSKIIGAITIEHSEANAFTHEDIDSIIILSFILRIIIEYQNQYQNLINLNKELKVSEDLLWLFMITKKWGHVINKRAITCDINCRLILDKIDSSNLPENDKSEIIESIETIEKCINDIREPIKSKRGQSGKNIIEWEANILISDIVEFLREQDRDIKINFSSELNGNERIRVDREMMNNILEYLYDNSREALRNCDDKNITVKMFTNANFLIIHFTDSGCGIPEDFKPYIFLQPKQKNIDEEGIGIGLLLVKKLINKIGGTIENIDPGPRTTTFELKFPYKVN